MKTDYRTVPLLLILNLLPLSHVLRSQDSGPGERSAYESAIDKWHAKRIATLTSKTSWLSLAGLFWLKEGENSFGTGKENDLVFPEAKGPTRMGVIELDEGRVSVHIQEGVDVRSDSLGVTHLQLKTDADGKPTLLSHGSLSWFVIKRGDRFAVRLRDAENPRIGEFKGIERYPVDSMWRIPARLVPYDPPRTIKVPNIIGTVDEEPCPGSLVFAAGEKTFQLDPIAEEATSQLFVVFADETNGSETYGGGRFVYVDAPGPDGMTVIDFNKSYNPPCAFTEFATCPLPPRQNRLPFPLRAGERKYLGFEH